MLHVLPRVTFTWARSSRGIISPSSLAVSSRLYYDCNGCCPPPSQPYRPISADPHLDERERGSDGLMERAEPGLHSRARRALCTAQTRKARQAPRQCGARHAARSASARTLSAAYTASMHLRCLGGSSSSAGCAAAGAAAPACAATICAAAAAFASVRRARAARSRGSAAPAPAALQARARTAACTEALRARVAMPVRDTCHPRACGWLPWGVPVPVAVCEAVRGLRARPAASAGSAPRRRRVCAGGTSPGPRRRRRRAPRAPSRTSASPTGA
jgi:hypothetical protein